MPESEEMAASRLEAALERIARRAAERPMGSLAPDAASAPNLFQADPRLADIATRLDALIASLRAVLGHQV
ncbi:MAG: hypothetical protein ACREFO_03415 [Acetobacteraceae bacterium]